MISATLYCLRCGQSRTVVKGKMRGDGYLACLRCGNDIFSADQDRAPRPPVEYPLSASDLRLLRSLRISAWSTMTVTIRGMR